MPFAVTSLVVFSYLENLYKNGSDLENAFEGHVAEVEFSVLSPYAFMRNAR